MTFLNWYSSLDHQTMFFLGLGVIIIIATILQTLLKIVSHITIAFGARKVGHWPKDYMKKKNNSND